jgi:hypothetical protein
MSDAPVLQLRDDALVNTGKGDLVPIEAMMIWPDDRAKRDGYAAAAFAEEIPEIVEAIAQKHGPLSPAELGALLKSQHDAPRIEDFRSDFRANFAPGVCAGRILRLAITDVVSERGAHASMTWINEEAARSIPARSWPSGTRPDPTTIENCWTRFRPVAHFWATYLELVGTDKAYPFPCRLKDLAEFLTMAEEYFDSGTTLKTHQAPSTILEIHETVLVPKVSPSQAGKDSS